MLLHLNNGLESTRLELCDFRHTNSGTSLIPPDKWDWFCLDNVRYHGRDLTILWDRNGTKYHKGKGLRIFADGIEIAKSDRITSVVGIHP